MIKKYTYDLKEYQLYINEGPILEITMQDLQKVIFLGNYILKNCQRLRDIHNIAFPENDGYLFKNPTCITEISPDNVKCNCIKYKIAKKKLTVWIKEDDREQDD